MGAVDVPQHDPRRQIRQQPASRAASPGVYEAALAPAPDPARWLHARIEVGAARVRVFVDGAARPCLEVARLGGGGGDGIGLWVDSQPGAFANLRLTAPRR